jgi:hypothetical protein
VLRLRGQPQSTHSCPSTFSLAGGQHSFRQREQGAVQGPGSEGLWPSSSVGRQQRGWSKEQQQACAQMARPAIAFCHALATPAVRTCLHRCSTASLSAGSPGELRSGAEGSKRAALTGTSGGR